MIVRFRIPLSTRAPHGETNAFLAGDPAVLVDPAGRSSELDDAVSDSGVQHIVVTHTHPDHVAAVEHYAERTDATVWCRYGREAAFEAATGVTTDRTFVDGTPIGGSGVVAMETPGHAPEHTSFVAGTDAMVGDLLMADSSVFVGKPGGDMRAYYASLRRSIARDLDALHPAHGDAVSNPDIRLREVLAHRLDREHRIERAVVEADARTVDDILDAAYDKDITGLEDLAARTIRAHLQKLAVEGRVEWDGRVAIPP